MNQPLRALDWMARLTAAAIMAQTLYFKFTAAPESVYIFETLGVEPAGRLLAGASELVAVALLLFPRTAGVGGAMTVGIMAGAVLSHLTILGVEVEDDGGTLFTLALVTLAAGTVTAWLHRRELPVIGRPFPA